MCVRKNEIEDKVTTLLLPHLHYYNLFFHDNCFDKTGKSVKTQDSKSGVYGKTKSVSRADIVKGKGK